MTRVFFDIEIGTNPDCATALLFALKHPEIEVVGVAIPGSGEGHIFEARSAEAKAVLEYASKKDIKIIATKELTAEIVNELNIDHSVISGSVENISQLVLDEADFGHIHIGIGVFSKILNRGKMIDCDLRASRDGIKDEVRVLLSQYENMTISSLDASTALALDAVTQFEIGKKHPFLKARYEGFHDYLMLKHDSIHCQIILHAVLPVCDILGIPGISRETIEFVIQANGSFKPTYLLKNIQEPIAEFVQSKREDTIPTPTVKHEVIRTVDSFKIFEELLRIL